MPHLLDITAVFITGLMTGNEFAVAAFIHPALGRLTPRSHAEAASRIAAVLGRVMPFWYALGLIVLVAELWSRRLAGGGRPDRGLLAAAVLWTLTIAVTILALVPINNRIAKLDPDSPYPTWLEDRAMWDALHRVRVCVLSLAFVLLLRSVLV